jgi:phosphatidylinositol glycan class N
MRRQVSSFELKSVYRFMAVFNPFLMGGMLLFKIALPFVLVAATFRTVTALENINTTVSISLSILSILTQRQQSTPLQPLHPLTS